MSETIERNKEIAIEAQKERFANLGEEGQKQFRDSLVSGDYLTIKGEKPRKFFPEQADRITTHFQNGTAGSIEEALNLMMIEDNESNKNPSA